MLWVLTWENPAMLHVDTFYLFICFTKTLRLLNYTLRYSLLGGARLRSQEAAAPAAGTGCCSGQPHAVPTAGARPRAPVLPPEAPVADAWCEAEFMQLAQRCPSSLHREAPGEGCSAL